MAILLLDVGGTGIKCGAWGAHGLLFPPCSYSARSDGDQNTILHHFSTVLQELTSRAGEPITGVGFAFPGPFDYENGISFMQGIGKFDSIYGVSLPKALGLDTQMIFCNDVDAYALGATVLHPELKQGRTLCITLGTGCGSAFLQDGCINRMPLCGMAENGWVYGEPYKDSIIDDYLSARGLARLAGEFEMPEDGKTLSLLAEKGNAKACEIFRLFGNQLVPALGKIIQVWSPQHLVLGGQITCSYSLFGKPLDGFLESVGCKLYRCTERELPLLGLATLFL